MHEKNVFPLFWRASLCRNLSFETIGLREHFSVENYGILSIPYTALLLLITPNERVDTAYIMEGDRYQGLLGLQTMSVWWTSYTRSFCNSKTHEWCSTMVDQQWCVLRIPFIGY